MARPNPRVSNGHRRRELRARVLAAYDQCGICGQPVDKTLGMAPGQHGPRCRRPDCSGCIPHPMRPEVDEILPVSKGGDPLAWGNVRLTHRQRICNQRRGDGTRQARAQRATALMRPVTTSRPW